MSQEKVNKYKEEKANREKLMKKKKREEAFLKAGGILVAVVIVGWIGFSAFDKFYEAPKSTYEIKTDAVDGYLQGLSAEVESE